MNALITYLAGALGGWCLRVIWVEIRQLRSERRYTLVVLCGFCEEAPADATGMCATCRFEQWGET